MSVFRGTSPTRVDLAGRTLDFWPLYMFLRETTTVNFAIDIETSAEIKEREDSKVILRSLDQKKEKEYANLDEALADESGEWLLLRTQIEFWRPEKGFELTTSSQSPVGGGLGGSSSLSISMIKAFSSWLGKDLSPEKMIELSGNIEARVLHTPIGTQDYHPPVHGGINILRYGAEGIAVDVLPESKEAFAEHFVLVYTGRPHHSGMNNWLIYKAAVEKDEKVLGALSALNEIALEVAEVCRKGEWSRLAPLLNREFEERVKLSPAVSSPEIERLKEISMASGAEAFKICGAGGGGCVLVVCQSGRKKDVVEAVQSEGFEVLNVQPVAPLRS